MPRNEVVCWMCRKCFSYIYLSTAISVDFIVIINFGLWSINGVNKITSPRECNNLGYIKFASKILFQKKTIRMVS